VGESVENLPPNNKNNKNDNSSESSCSSDDDENDGNLSDDEGTYDTSTMKMATKKGASASATTNNETKTISEPLRQACEVAESYLTRPEFFPADVKPVSL